MVIHDQMELFKVFLFWNIDGEPIECENDFDSDEEIDDGDDSWDEMEVEQEPTKCLFCDVVENSIEKTIEHLKQQHHISLGAIKRKFNLDQYSYIKVISRSLLCR